MTTSVLNRMPWATAQTKRAEQLLDREWLVTNGLGGYASGTVSGAVTRRYHGLLIAALPLSAAGIKMQVYKTATCGCCAKWVEHLRANGFDVTVSDVPSTAPYRQKLGIPDKLQSCHSASVNGYSIEGHVPAREILKLIKSEAKAKGLAVPGMPATSPLRALSFS